MDSGILLDDLEDALRYGIIQGVFRWPGHEGGNRGKGIYWYWGSCRDENSGTTP